MTNNFTREFCLKEENIMSQQKDINGILPNSVGFFATRFSLYPNCKIFKLSLNCTDFCYVEYLLQDTIVSVQTSFFSLTHP